MHWELRGFPGKTQGLFGHLVLLSTWTNSKHFVFTLGASSSSAPLWWASLERNPLGQCGDRLGSSNETGRHVWMFGHTLEFNKKKKHQQGNEGWSVRLKSIINILLCDKCRQKCNIPTGVQSHVLCFTAFCYIKLLKHAKQKHILLVSLLVLS